MDSSSVRVRFAPSPTGFMHLGNVRAALMNFLFARSHQGTFILRIEDTDSQRTIESGVENIIENLAWLGLSYDEGPGKGGPYGPYFQSERASVYAHYLEQLKKKAVVYPCFCTAEDLEKKRLRQIALKIAPRYDQACLKLSEAERGERMATTPYIWRFKLDGSIVEIHDLAHGTIRYDLKHFSDFPLTRQDGSFTFIFANFVDDVAMKITHVFRGEDHLSNTASQAALYKAFGAPLPIFWHIPIMCNSTGRKLSKRDFGFSLNDLQSAGFLPQAIDNYLAILGGSFAEEIMDLPTLITAIDFKHVPSAGQIKYDLEKLRWINHKWITRLPVTQVARLCKPFLLPQYPATEQLSAEELARIVGFVHADLVTLADSVPMLACYFVRPTHLLPTLPMPVVTQITQWVRACSSDITPESCFDSFKIFCEEHKIQRKEAFSTIRGMLTGSTEGLGVKELMQLLGTREVLARLDYARRERPTL